MVDNLLTNIVVTDNSLVTYHKVHFIVINHPTITLW